MPDVIKYESPCPKPQPVQGSSGLYTQLPGACITVDAIGGGIGSGIYAGVSQPAVEGKVSK